MSERSEFIDPTVAPSGTGCLECEAVGGWWVHLRRCALCGHVGCCDDSLETHATKHYESTGHPIIQSFEPGEEWFWNYAADDYASGPLLAPPESHPESQRSPGPADRLPEDWRDQLARKRVES